MDHLEVSLDLPLLLLKTSSGLLLLGTLEILIGLSLGGGQVLLLLVELVDDLILLGDLVLEGPDSVVTVALLSLNLGDGELDILNVLLDSANAARVSLDLSGQGNT